MNKLGSHTCACDDGFELTENNDCYGDFLGRFLKDG